MIIMIFRVMRTVRAVRVHMISAGEYTVSSGAYTVSGGAYTVSGGAYKWITLLSRYTPIIRVVTNPSSWDRSLRFR